MACPVEEKDNTHEVDTEEHDTEDHTEEMDTDVVDTQQVEHKKLSAQEHFYARMRLPIGTSSIRVPITEDVRKSIEKYKLEIEERHRNGMY